MTTLYNNNYVIQHTSLLIMNGKHKKLNKYLSFFFMGKENQSINQSINLIYLYLIVVVKESGHVFKSCKGKVWHVRTI